MTAAVIDARAAFECARHGHISAMRFTSNVCVKSWICQCDRCGRLAEFDANPPAVADSVEGVR